MRTLLFGLVPMGVVPAVMAASVERPGQGSVFQVRIDAAPLSMALRELARQTGLQIGRFSDDAAMQPQVGPVTGELTSVQALEQLLAGTGFTYRFVNDRTVAILRIPVSTTERVLPETSEKRSLNNETGGRPVTHPRFGFLVRLGVALGLCIPAAGMVCAQEAVAPASSSGAATDDKGELDTVIVTAERRSTDLQRTPVAVSVVDADYLRRSGVGDFRNVLQDVPSVAVQPMTHSKNAPAVAIRGVGVDGANKQLSTAIYEDGVVLNNQSGMFYDLARVEVLRGPQGTLYGGTALGGAINVISNDPTREFGGSALLELANDGLWHTTGVLNVPMGESWAVRAAFNQYRRGSSADSNVVVDNYVNARIKALYSPNDRFSLLLGINYNDKGGFTEDEAYVDSSGRLTNRLANNLGGLGRERIFKYYANLKYDFGFAELNYLAAFQRDVNDTNWLGTDSPVQGQYRTRWPYYDTDSHELRLVGAVGGRLTWVAGLYYMRRAFLRTESYGGDPRMDLEDFQTIVNHRIATLGVYGQATYSLTDSTRLTLGARQSGDDVFQTTSNLNIPNPARNRFALYDKSTQNFTYLVRAEHDLTADSLLYGSVSTAYRPGGLGIIGTAYKPETLTAYQLGSKNRLTSWLQADVNAFYYDYPSMQVPLQVCSDYPSCAVVNVVGAMTVSMPTQYYGAELELRARLTPNDQLSLTPAYLHARFTSDVSLENPELGSVGTLPTKGGTPPHAPTWTIAASYVHTFHLGSGGSIDLGTDAHYETQQYVAFDTSPYLDTPAKKFLTQRGYTIANAHLSYAPANDRYSITAYIHNATDVKYRTSQGDVAVPYNEARTYGLVLSANF
ncbi:MAG: TonB-dependent receptor [Steroidobacteraceae bacterium]